MLKTDTVFPVQTRRRLASFENAGGEETKLFPPVNIFLTQIFIFSLSSERGKEGFRRSRINPSPQYFL